MKNNIKDIRRKMKITQQELADSVNVSRQAINAIENDRMNPTLSLAFKITYILKQEKVEDVFINELRN